MVSLSNSLGDEMTQQTIDTGNITWTDPVCPTARALDLIGDRWCLLIVRDAMENARTFSDFQQRTGIARNILTDRLRRLVDRGILVRQAAPSGKRQHYALTPAGRDLFAVIVALRQWGNDMPSFRERFAPPWSMSRASLSRRSGRSAQTGRRWTPTRRGSRWRALPPRSLRARRRSTRAGSGQRSTRA